MRDEDRWIWISSGLFALVVGVVKRGFYPYPLYNPPVLYPMVIAFLTSAFFWWWLIARSRRPTWLRGGTVGALVGLLTPMVMWPFFTGVLGLVEGRMVELLGWSLVYMYMALVHVCWWTVPLGAAIGAAIAYVQQRQTEAWMGNGVHGEGSR